MAKALAALAAAAVLIPFASLQALERPHRGAPKQIQPPQILQQQDADQAQAPAPGGDEDAPMGVIIIQRQADTPDDRNIPEPHLISDAWAIRA